MASQRKFLHSSLVPSAVNATIVIEGDEAGGFNLRVSPTAASAQASVAGSLLCSGLIGRGSAEMRYQDYLPEDQTFRSRLEQAVAMPSFSAIGKSMFASSVRIAGISTASLSAQHSWMKQSLISADLRNRTNDGQKYADS